MAKPDTAITDSVEIIRTRSLQDQWISMTKPYHRKLAEAFLEHMGFSSDEDATEEETLALMALIAEHMRVDAEHHTEMLTPPLQWGPPDYRDRHLTQDWRDMGDKSPWDGPKYIWDPRCPHCLKLWAASYNGIIPVIP